MTSYKDQNVKRELIMKHYSSPNNKMKIENSDVDLYSNHCVDEIHLKLNIEDNIIKEAFFDGEGCAVFLSSTDIMLDNIKGKTKEEALRLVEAYEEMIIKGIATNENLLNNLLIYKNVSSHLNRLHCAEMISNALKKIL